MSPLDNPSPRAEQAGERARAPRGRGRLAKATTVASAAFVLSLPTHPQYASVSPLNAPVSSDSVVHVETNAAHELPRAADSFATTASPTALPQTQAPVTSAPDTTWGIRTPILAGLLCALFGAAAGAGTTAVLYRRGRRDTLSDRAEDQQRQDAAAAELQARQDQEQRRRDARESWKPLYDKLGRVLPAALAIYVDARRELLHRDDDEARQIPKVLRDLLIAVEQASGNRSKELTDSLTELHDCMQDLEAALLPPRTSLTDPNTLNLTELTELTNQTKNQTLAAIKLGRLVRAAETAVNTEWGNR